jgi:hypothetical protein
MQLSQPKYYAPFWAKGQEGRNPAVTMTFLLINELYLLKELSAEASTALR